MTRTLSSEVILSSADEDKVRSALAFIESQGDFGFIERKDGIFDLHRFRYEGLR